MYEVIVLGATFAAAGIAHTYKKNCLVLEQSMQAGGEFFGALCYGAGCDRPLYGEAAKLQERFASSHIYSCDAEIYPYLQQADVLFDTQIVSVKKTEKGFLCTTWGVEGFCEYEARCVIDTRSSEKMSHSKTFNLLVESKETPAFSGMTIEKAGLEDHYVLRLPVALSCGYADARAAAKKIVAQFSETQKLLLSAWGFDYRVKGDYPKTENGILQLPSKMYADPVLAFGAGLEVRV